DRSCRSTDYPAPAAIGSGRFATKHPKLRRTPRAGGGSQNRRAPEFFRTARNMRRRPRLPLTPKAQQFAVRYRVADRARIELQHGAHPVGGESDEIGDV